MKQTNIIPLVIEKKKSSENDKAKISVTLAIFFPSRQIQVKVVFFGVSLSSIQFENYKTKMSRDSMARHRPRSCY